MGIDELLNFIESKDNKKGNKSTTPAGVNIFESANTGTGKKNSKKNKSNNTHNLSKKNNSENFNQCSITFNEELSNSQMNGIYEEDNEFELFKNKLLGDSIDAHVIKKIKPKFDSAKWD